MAIPGAAPAIGAHDIGPEPQRPDLYLVQDASVPLDQKIDLVLSLNDEAWTDGGLVSQVTLPKDVVIGGFSRLIQQREPEDSKPPAERDREITARLQQRSDRLLGKLPVDERAGVVFEAYGFNKAA